MRLRDTVLAPNLDHRIARFCLPQDAESPLRCVPPSPYLAQEATRFAVIPNAPHCVNFHLHYNDL
jgi:hypothetical protein